MIKSAITRRLAWLITQSNPSEKERAKVDVLLKNALDLNPTEPKSRRELAGVLAYIGKFNEALKLYEGLTLDYEDHLNLVGLYSAVRLFEKAEAECKLLLKMPKPG